MNTRAKKKKKKIEIWESSFKGLEKIIRWKDGQDHYYHISNYCVQMWNLDSEECWKDLFFQNMVLKECVEDTVDYRGNKIKSVQDHIKPQLSSRSKKWQNWDCCILAHHEKVRLAWKYNNGGERRSQQENRNTKYEVDWLNKGGHGSGFARTEHGRIWWRPLTHRVSMGLRQCWQHRTFSSGDACSSTLFCMEFIGIWCFFF